MITSNLDSFVCVPLPIKLYEELVKKYPDSVSTLICNLTENFLEDTKDGFIEESGIYWDALYLPNGTELRVKKSRINDYGVAEIANEKIIYEGITVESISKFASKVRDNTSVNAWVTVEIKRPSDRSWQLANNFRR